jgi:hypothetical protein
MIATKDKIEEFIDTHGICIGEHGIATVPRRCTNISKVWGGHSYETKLTREGVEGYEWLYTYSGVGVWGQNLSEALWFAVEEAEHGGCLESYERWHQEYDYDYLFEDEEGYEHGQEFQRNWYEACKDYYTKITKILGQELYSQLSDLVMGE